MSRLSALNDALRDTSALIAQIERKCATVNSPSLRLMLRSYEKRQRQLAQECHDEAMLLARTLRIAAKETE